MASDLDLDVKMELDDVLARMGSNNQAGTTEGLRTLSAAAPPPLEKDASSAPGTTAQMKLGLNITRPPTPPAKESPAQANPTTTLSLTEAPSPPPTRELPKRPPPLQLGPRPGTSGSDKVLPQRPAIPLPLREPLGMNPLTRPSTALSDASATSGPPMRIVGSTKRLSWSSIATSRRPIKYGTGKFKNTELVPQPSDDPEDPLNWPQWRKELNFGALMLMVCLTGVMKTALISVNCVLAMGYTVSYTAVAALTGVPLLLSAVTGFASLVAARIWGKRPLYLASLLLVFIGTAWNTSVQTSYGQCMAARVFQGLGWGAFDTLVMGSIHDTYFEHERCRRVAAYTIISVASTWGAPLIGGVASETGRGFGLQFVILSSFFALAIPLMVLGAPETAFDRAYTLAQTPATASTGYTKSQPLRPRPTFSVEACRVYVSKMRPYSYLGEVDRTVLLQAPRALMAPTTALLFAVSLIPTGALWGLASSVSLLFSPMPFTLTPTSLGLLMTGPFVLATATAAAFALTPGWHVRFTPRLHMAALAGGTALAMTGALALGLHVSTSMTRPAGDDGSTSVFATGYLGDRVKLPAVGLALGLAAAGLFVLDATARPSIRRSTQFTSSNLGVALRNTSDMDAALGVARTAVAGAFVMALPNAVFSVQGLRSTCIGVAVAQAVVAGLIAAVWWFWDENVRRLDGRVMKLVDLDMLKRAGSFFDMD